jgi:hypothetical protein
MVLCIISLISTI